MHLQTCTSLWCEFLHFKTVSLFPFWNIWVELKTPGDFSSRWAKFCRVPVINDFPLEKVKGWLTPDWLSLLGKCTAPCVIEAPSLGYTISSIPRQMPGGEKTARDQVKMVIRWTKAPLPHAVSISHQSREACNEQDPDGAPCYLHMADRRLDSSIPYSISNVLWLAAMMEFISYCDDR